MAVETGDVAPEFDLEVGYRERVTLADVRSRANVLLVFHPFAFTPVCEDEARDLQENLQSFRDAGTEIVFVSCDPSAARQAWKRSSAPSTPSRPTSGPTEPPRRRTACSTRRTALPIAARS
jgi:mycoredoxin-dependent peroxiredoxin